jgi:hypothetical protein
MEMRERTYVVLWLVATIGYFVWLFQAITSYSGSLL